MSRTQLAQKLKFVCILAVPRTGSSHLCHLLHSCPDVHMKSELFHPRGVHLFTEADHAALRAASGGEIVDDPSLCRWRAAHPGRTLELIGEAGGGKPLVFKLFGAHLRRELVESEIFSREDVGYIVLRRRPIESFISGMKARTVKLHINVDTTAVKPTPEVEQFVKWARYVRSWYEWIDEQIDARGLPAIRISYEKQLKSIAPETALNQTLAALEAIGVPKLEPGHRIWSATVQDREQRYQDRIANWAAFEAALNADRRQAKLLKWAQEVR